MRTAGASTASVASISKSQITSVLDEERTKAFKHHAHLLHQIEHARENTLVIVKRMQKSGEFTTQFLGPLQEGSPYEWLTCSPYTEPELDEDTRDAEMVLADRNILKAQHSIRWFNEFLDLVLVAGVYNIVYNLSYQLKYIDNHPDAWVACIEAFVIWGSFAAIYIEVTLFWARFAHKVSRSIKVLYYFFGLFSVFMAMYAKGEEKYSVFDDSRGFLGSYIFSLFALAGLYFVYFLDTIDDEYATNYLQRRLKIFVFAIVVCFPACFIDSKTLGCVSLLVSWVSMMVVEAISLRVNHKREPVYGEFVIERLSIFVMIVLGESVLSLILNGLQTSENDGELTMCIITICSYIVIFALYWMYFTNQHENAFTNSNIFGSCFYVMLHIPLTFFLLLTGFGFKYLLETSAETEDSEETLCMNMPGPPGIGQRQCPTKTENKIVHNFLAVGLPFSVLLIWLIRATHADMRPDSTKLLSFVARPLLAGSLVIPAVAFTGYEDYRKEARIEMILIAVIMALIMFLDKVIFARESLLWEHWRHVDISHAKDHSHDDHNDHGLEMPEFEKMQSTESNF